MMKEKMKIPALVLAVFVVSVCLGVYWYINLRSVGWQDSRISKLPIVSESLSNYLEDPSSCSTELGKKFEEVSLIPKKNSFYDLKLSGAAGGKFELEDIDLNVFIPRVPEIAKGDPLLTKITLVQRELNRNDTIFRNISDKNHVANLSNNCLRQGLWETYIIRTEGVDEGKTYHGWFEFPHPLYRKLFKELNGFELEPYEPVLQHYQRLDGEEVNLQHLRTVIDEKTIPNNEIDFHHDSKILHMGEQQHKAKLIVNDVLFQKYNDLYKPENQPVKVMQFDEPGRYKKNKLMKFDFSFLKEPTSVVLRKVHNDRLNKTFNELEIEFPYGERTIAVKNWPFLVKRNGLRLILGGWNLEDIPQASKQPIPAKDFGRFTFGIGTPDIYVTYPNRIAEFKKNSNVYLLLLDKNNKYQDNHTTGLDQVYISRLPDNTFVIYLVSYERIILLAHWNLKPPETHLVKTKAVGEKFHN